jgi:hypothetical protein
MCLAGRGPSTRLRRSLRSCSESGLGASLVPHEADRVRRSVRWTDVGGDGLHLVLNWPAAHRICAICSAGCGTDCGGVDPGIGRARRKSRGRPIRTAIGAD